MDQNADQLLTVTDAAAMEALGSRIASLSPGGFRIFLSGELGAGKTTFTRGFLRGLGYADKVKSPTYTLVEPYQCRGRQVCHFDLYRLNGPRELEAIGIRDYMDGDTTCLVEWPERGDPAIGIPDLRIAIEILRQGRQVSLQAVTDRARTLLASLER